MEFGLYSGCSCCHGDEEFTLLSIQDGLPVVSDNHVVANTRSGQLRIESVAKSDAGKYLCIASNVVGRMTAERIVDVHSTSYSFSLFIMNVMNVGIFL